MTKKQLAAHEKTEVSNKRHTAHLAAAPAKKPYTKPELAIVKVPANGLVKAQIPTSAKQIAKYQLAAEARRPTFAALAKQTLDDPDDIAFVDALLTEVTQLEDAAKAMRSSATGPLYGVIRTVESWFKPYLEELLYARGVCKKLIGDARIAQAELASSAREIAADAAKIGDGARTVEALNVAREAAAPDGARASSKLAWHVASVDPGALPDFMITPNAECRPLCDAEGALHLWCPDTAKIQAFADTFDGDGPAPVIPGVAFERIARVGASHK